MLRILAAYLATAFSMLILGLTGLLTLTDPSPAKLNVIFFIAFFLSIFIGGMTFVIGAVNENNSRKEQGPAPSWNDKRN